MFATSWFVWLSVCLHCRTPNVDLKRCADKQTKKAIGGWDRISIALCCCLGTLISSTSQLEQQLQQTNNQNTTTTITTNPFIGIIDTIQLTKDNESHEQYKEYLEA
ncbi:hypothetical protein DFA_04920 [Cavenderia fasciculata]|uniref:Uncharacterized protein n=1 Tax=Cavenderia fasciculata TaxID=261658 RepID=F4PME0_CACFS|nr:uncharacterized protein DFA_04920 [Cavenderia fasciculata]EGG22790.1 hypothetical protein DFA_04920 [Cavenderia fasciculata]|eukprot:XP_004360641.1 hypothetical protein DFA_04920 [Cavenderia fasciculata]